MILELLWARLERGLDALAEKFGQRLTATARNILHSWEDAEESVNDTYLAIWNAIPPQKPEPLAAYVYRTGRNQALKRLRTNTAAKRSGYELSLEELAGCLSGALLDEAVEARALGLAIDTFLDTVPPASRIAFLRRYWFGDAVKDIARSLGTTPGAVSVRLGRTRQLLRDYLIREGFCNAGKA